MKNKLNFKVISTPEQQAAKVVDAYDHLRGIYITGAGIRRLPIDVRMQFLAMNRVNTDPYNNTMFWLKNELGEETWKTLETYVMSCRRSPFGKLIHSGGDFVLQNLFRAPITAGEVAVAKEAAEARGQQFPSEMWNWVLNEYGGRPPLDIYMPPLGTVLLPHEPMFVVRGPGELAAHFEPWLIPAFFEALVCTHMWQLNDHGAIMFFLQSMRSSANPLMDMMINHGALPAGHDWASNNMAAAAFEQVWSSGTVAHRLMSFLMDYFHQQGAEDPELESYRHLSRIMPKPMYLVDLVDTVQGVRKTIKAIKESKNRGEKKLHCIRLDSGNMKKLVPQVLNMLDKAGLNDVRLAISDSVTKESKAVLRNIVTAAGYNPERLGFGAGGGLAWENKSRDAASAVFKSVQVDGRGTVKLSDSIGKFSLSGWPQIFRWYDAPDGRQSIIGQWEENPGKQYQGILVKAVSQGLYIYPETNEDATVAIRAREQWKRLTQQRHCKSEQTVSIARQFVATHAGELLKQFDEEYREGVKP